jgi:hypothetical protein
MGSQQQWQDMARVAWVHQAGVVLLLLVVVVV